MIDFYEGDENIIDDEMVDSVDRRIILNQRVNKSSYDDPSVQRRNGKGDHMVAADGELMMSDVMPSMNVCDSQTFSPSSSQMFVATSLLF